MDLYGKIITLTISLSLWVGTPVNSKQRPCPMLRPFNYVDSSQDGVRYIGDNVVACANGKCRGIRDDRLHSQIPSLSISTDDFATATNLPFIPGVPLECMIVNGSLYEVRRNLTMHGCNFDVYGDGVGDNSAVPGDGKDGDNGVVGGDGVGDNSVVTGEGIGDKTVVNGNGVGDNRAVPGDGKDDKNNVGGGDGAIDNGRGNGIEFDNNDDFGGDDDLERYRFFNGLPGDENGGVPEERQKRNAHTVITGGKSNGGKCCETISYFTRTSYATNVPIEDVYKRPHYIQGGQLIFVGQCSTTNNCASCVPEVTIQWLLAWDGNASLQLAQFYIWSYCFCQ